MKIIKLTLILLCFTVALSTAINQKKVMKKNTKYKLSGKFYEELNKTQALFHVTYSEKLYNHLKEKSSNNENDFTFFTFIIYNCKERATDTKVSHLFETKYKDLKIYFKEPKTKNPNEIVLLRYLFNNDIFDYWKDQFKKDIQINEKMEGEIGDIFIKTINDALTLYITLNNFIK